MNDVHSRLNPTRVASVVRPDSLEALPEIVRRAGAQGLAISIAGGRHAMGGQQFGTDTLHVDMSGMSRVLRFDPVRGEIEVEAGELVAWLLRVQEGREPQWGIIQKQTGADRFSIGGSVAANIHGRGLRHRPFVADIESLVLVDGGGGLRRCDRSENSELFRLAVGGYGLFGIVAAVTLRLAPRQRVERVVELVDVDELMPAFERRIADGFLFGDFQFATDARSASFLRRGVFSCYRPAATHAATAHRELSADDWRRLLRLAHTDKSRAFAEYSAYYRATSGQTYWSDTHQLSVYLDGYHAALDRDLGAACPASEMITEVSVPRHALARFMADVRRELRQSDADLIYGTIRLIERDDETFLAWAREPLACVIFNLHTEHSAAGLARSAAAFRRLIDLGIARGGTYYLTYHRWATRRQVVACYPRFAEFLRRKRQHDPAERFQSDWYRHHRAMFADGDAAC